MNDSMLLSGRTCKGADRLSGPAGGDDEADVPFVLPVTEKEQPNEKTLLGLIELLLKNPSRVDQLNGEPERQGELFPRFLFIALASYLIFSFAMLPLLHWAPPRAYPHSLLLRMPPANWHDNTALSLPLAYTISIVLAACVCLPTFYFFSLLSGAKLSWLQIVSLIGKGTAANSIMLLGILPIYVAVAMGMIIFKAPDEAMQWTLKLGLLLPFIAGLWGLRAIYIGITNMVQTMPDPWRSRRQCFLRRLTFSWTVVYATVLPIMIYRLWEFFADQLVRGG